MNICAQDDLIGSLNSLLLWLKTVILISQTFQDRVQLLSKCLFGWNTSER